MSFGRWLLTHSLSLFLVAMLLAAWFWRDELELERAWTQLRQVGGSMELAASKAGKAPAETAVATASPEDDRPDAAREPVPEPAPTMPQTASPAPASEPANDEALPAAGNHEESLLQAARKAFWSRDFDRSIALYQRLIEEQPGNPDHLGELGNIYYNLNRFDRAAELFHRAGRLLVEQGDLARARQLLPALMSLDREKGQSLEQSIEQALSAGGGQS
jgi:tetratricopeptide (TPR) repeat protein